MRHIDDGALHAYLDGAHDQIGGPGGVEALEAHLAECAACRARLGAEREVRDRASEILAMGAPRATELPPFAALEGRREPARAGASAAAARRTPARRPYPWRRTPLAWAVTVVLALGAGWIAREMLETPGDERLSIVTAGEVESESERTESVRAREDVGFPQARPAADEGLRGPGAPAAEAGQPPGGRSDRVAADPVSGAELDEGRMALLQPDERPEAAAPAAPPPPVESAPESRAMDPARQPRTGGLPADVTADELERERREQRQQRVLIGEPVDAARYRQAAAAPPPAPPPPPAIEARVIELQEIVVTGAAGEAEPLWRPVDRRAADAALGQAILIVPGLPVIAIEEPETGAPTTIRVRQRLETGEVLTLQQSLVEPDELRGAEAAAAAAPARAAESEQLGVRFGARAALMEVEAREEPDGSLIELRQGDVVIHVGAPIPLDRLRELLARLR